jgi:hypothetical protein
MSFSINGTTWEPQTASDHTEEIINKINTILQENNITDEDGNTIQLAANYANAMYLLALASGARVADMDTKLEEAINSFNIALCDDQQIENLLPIAGVNRNPGSYSTLNVVVTAGDEDATIPAGTRLPFEDVFFVVDTEAVIPAGTSQIVPTTCSTIGPVVALSGEVTAFEYSIANVENVINMESSVPGIAPETTNELRQRLIKGNTIKYTLEGCKTALEELTGISYARIYFNYNTSATITLPGGVVLQPRHAYIVIKGSSDALADTYATYMSAPTQNSPIAQAKASTVELTVAAASGGSCTVPQGTECTYNGYTFTTDEELTVAASETGTVRATCTVTGPVAVPALAITEFDTTISNLDSVVNETAADEGYDDPAHVQNWNTSSGQSIPIYYDDATNVKIFVKITLKADAAFEPQVVNQLKRDLILASAGWEIGEDITSLKLAEPFIDCTYTDIAYVQISSDGENWSNIVSTGCNTIPIVKDNSITVEQLDD